MGGREGVVNCCARELFVHTAYGRLLKEDELVAVNDVNAGIRTAWAWAPHGETTSNEPWYSNGTHE